MKRLAIFLSFALAAACGDEAIDDTEQQGLDSQGGGRPEPSAAGVHWARGFARPGGGGSPNLTYHGGPVQHGSAVQAIFWGTSWASSGGAKISALDTFYGGVGGSTYAQTNTEYTDGSGHVSASVTYGGHFVDSSAVPRNPGSKTSTILNEVCKVLGPNAVSGTYYPVYTDVGRGHAGFCAWHSAGTCPNGAAVQIGFFFKLDGDPGCDPGDTTTGHSQGIAALGNVTGHELSEMLTDPKLNAWFDSSGEENADKCAWTFGTNSVSLGGTQWKIQGNWSNAAFNAGTGYTNSSGQNGCLDGGNFR